MVTLNATKICWLCERAYRYVIEHFLARAFLDDRSGSKSELAKRRKHLIERLSSATLFSSVSNVLETFKKARERMAKAAELYTNA